MKTLRPLILCGCTSDTANSCALKSWVGRACLCPCHYTTEQTKRLISAYIHSGDGSTGQYMKKLWTKKTDPATVQMMTVLAGCGHERSFGRKLSKMAEQYVRQNPCDRCSPCP